MRKKLIVLSNFDGIGACLLSLLAAGFKIHTYYCCEIDENAVAVLRKNFPHINIIYLGDIKNWRNWNIDFSKIDLITGGFPCQSFSIAGKRLGFDDERGQLFYVLLDLLNEIQKDNPDVLFLFENVRMKKEYVEYINNLLGVKSILINSSLVSAQNRVRNYWTNIPNVVLPKDKKIKLSDIFPNMGGAGVRDRKVNGKYKAYMTIRKDNKANCLTSSSSTRQFYNFEENKLQYITPEQAEKLQGFPEEYTSLEGLCNTKRLKLIGNSWSIPTIVHIFSFMAG